MANHYHNGTVIQYIQCVFNAEGLCMYAPTSCVWKFPLPNPSEISDSTESVISSNHEYKKVTAFHIGTRIHKQKLS